MLPSVLIGSPVALVAYCGMSGRATSAIERIHAGKEHIVDDLRPLPIDLRFDLMDESPVVFREVDADIVRRRADPDGLVVPI